MSDVLTVEHAHVRFGGVQAVDGVSLSVPEGTILGLIGPNGSGKSTLLSAISRLLNLSEGRLRLGDRDYTSLPAHVASGLGIARTFQTVRLQPSMTVLENVMLGSDLPVGSQSIVKTWLRVRRAARDEARSPLCQRPMRRSRSGIY